MKKLAQLTYHRVFTTASGGAATRRHNQNLSHLIRTGRLRDARRLFDSVPLRDVVTYNSIISGYVRNRDITLARKLFDEMPHRDVVSWNSILSGYAMSRDSAEHEEGRRIFERMPVRDLFSYNTMLAGYARNRRMDNAMKLFDTMPERNVVSWNTMVTGFLGIGDVVKAVELFERMPVRDCTSLCALVSGLIRNGRFAEAEKVLVSTGTSEGMAGVVDAYNTLIAGFGQCGRVKDARKLFDMIPRGYMNVVSWNSMIMCYVKDGDILSARELFDAMPERDDVSWNSMIAGYVQAMEMEKAELLFRQLPDPDVRSWNSMICGFTQKGELDRARALFERMPHKTLVSWNTMVSGYEQNGDCQGAIEVFSQMQSANVRPDRHTFSSVLSACSGLAILRQGMQIHLLIAKTISPDIPINNALITMYSRSGSLADANAVFDGMKERDVVSWNAMIGGCAQHGLAREALELFEEMKRTREAPTQITFVSLLNACGHAGLVDEGKKEFGSMARDFGIMPTVEHYASLVDLIGRHGQLDEAMDVIKHMVVPPDRSVWGAFLSACRVHKNEALARVAAEALVEIEPESSAPYVLLHNVHAEEGRWDAAMEVRELMNRNGIVKQAGYSWIELQNSVHVFIAGDRSPPLAHEVFPLLESCTRISRDLLLA